MTRLLLVLVALCALVPVARAADTWLSASALPSQEPGHAWFIAESPDGTSRALMHVPPRGVGQAVDGVVRFVRPIETDIEALAAFGSTLWLIGAPQDGPDGRSFRPVRSIRAHSSLVEGVWNYLPAGRATAHPALPGEPELLAVGAPGGNLHTILGSQDPSMLILGASAWEPSERVLPAGEPVAIGSTEAGVSAITTAAQDPESLTLWTQDAAGWTPRLTGLDPSAHTARFIPGALVWSRNVGAATRELVRRDLAGEGPRSLGPVGDSTRPGVFVTLASSGRGIWIAADPSETTTGSALAPARYDLVEHSLYSGRLLYQGPAVQGGPISVEDFRVLTAVLVGATVLILVLVLRGEGDGVFELPTNCALAEPGRRLLGTFVDVLLVAAGTSLLTGVSVPALLTLSVLLEPGGGAALGIFVAFGFSAATLFELFFAGTPGKLMFGARVVRARVGEPVRISPAQAVIRNLLKWGLPPLAAMALLNPGGRHKGDALAKTVVVVPLDPAGAPEAPEATEDPGHSGDTDPRS